MPMPSVAVIDALNSLLEAEANSIFHFVGSGSPYLARATPKVRQTLERISHHLDLQTAQLGRLIRELGGEPATPPVPDADEQYLSFLSLKFLLPKLVEAKELMIQRYQSALGAVADNPAATALLHEHLKLMGEDLSLLKTAAADVAGERQAPSL